MARSRTSLPKKCGLWISVGKCYEIYHRHRPKPKNLNLNSRKCCRWQLRQWRIQKILKGGGGRKTIYQLRPHLSQMRTTKYMLFTRKKAAFWQKYEPIVGGGGRPHRPRSPFECATGWQWMPDVANVVVNVYSNCNVLLLLLLYTSLERRNFAAWLLVRVLSTLKSLGGVIVMLIHNFCNAAD